jgi:hypothetical protein
LNQVSLNVNRLSLNLNRRKRRRQIRVRVGEDRVNRSGQEEAACEQGAQTLYFALRVSHTQSTAKGTMALNAQQIIGGELFRLFSFMSQNYSGRNRLPSIARW